MSESDYRLGLLERGIVHAAQRQGLKTEQSVSDAVGMDPLAAQVGSDLVGRLVNGSPTALPEVEACEASKACTAGMMHGAITNIPPKSAIAPKPAAP